MTGLEADEIRERRKRLGVVFEQAPIRKTFGMELQYVHGDAVLQLPPNPNLSNYVGGVHGGVIATMLDIAGWFAVAPYYDEWLTTVEIHARYLRPANETEVSAVGKALRAGKRIAMADMEVRTQNGDLVAVGSGTFAVTTKNLRAELNPEG